MWIWGGAQQEEQDQVGSSLSTPQRALARIWATPCGRVGSVRLIVVDHRVEKVVFESVGIYSRLNSDGNVLVLILVAQSNGMISDPGGVISASHASNSLGTGFIGVIPQGKSNSGTLEGPPGKPGLAHHSPVTFTALGP
jgi:hypothetical protein